MLVLESGVSAILVGITGIMTAAVSGLFLWLSNRKPKDARKVSGIALTHKVLTETIEWQDGQINELRTEIAHLKGRIRRLENDKQRGNP